MVSESRHFITIRRGKGVLGLYLQHLPPQYKVILNKTTRFPGFRTYDKNKNKLKIKLSV